MSKMKRASTSISRNRRFTMKDRLKYGLFVTLIMFPCVFITERCESQDVRSCSWGDSPAIVKQKEGAHDYKATGNDDTFYFMGKIGGLNAAVAFYFIEKKLFKVRYLFLEEHTNKQSFINDFATVTDILDKKYGERRVEKIWSNDLYKDDFDGWGMAIAIGHLLMYTERETETTSIEHTITGDNYKIEHDLQYTSKQLIGKVKEKKEQDASKDF